MSKTPDGLYVTEQIRLCERSAIDESGLRDIELMERAGAGAWDVFNRLHGPIRSMAVFCGTGNNGGDAYVLARLAHLEGCSVVVYQHKTLEALSVTAQHAAALAQDAGVLCKPLEDVIDWEVQWVVDGLLGIGLQGDVYGPIAHAINLINDSRLPVLSLDVPSGLDADTGQILGVCIRATITVTFIAPKVGLYTLDGPDYSGEVLVDDLQIAACLDQIQPKAHRLDGHVLKQPLLPPRLKNSHKGMYGHVLIVGGGPGMPGAAFLAAQAALRVGAGVVTIATWPPHAGTVLPHLPEAMVYPVETSDDLLPLLKRASVCILGPGLGDTDWARELFAAAITAPLPLVIDASALRMLAEDAQQDDHWILTPHPGEAAALLGCTLDEIQADRLRAARLIQARYGGVVVLKGAGTVVYVDTQGMYICTAGNPGMSTAGMGDVLSGVIGGLLGQGLSFSKAALSGVWVHASAGDDAVARSGERGLLAGDLMPYLRQRVNKDA